MGNLGRWGGRNGSGGLWPALVLASAQRRRGGDDRRHRDGTTAPGGVRRAGTRRAMWRRQFPVIRNQNREYRDAQLLRIEKHSSGELPACGLCGHSVRIPSLAKAHSGAECKRTQENKEWRDAPAFAQTMRCLTLITIHSQYLAELRPGAAEMDFCCTRIMRRADGFFLQELDCLRD